MDSKTPRTDSSPPLRVKKENEEEIKDFAETAMNELLGWYGYERLELRRWAASRARDNSSPEQAADQKNKDECSWCGKSITSEGGALQQAGSAFCSELCFSQSRRANFKRAKTCDWCRHVRHTVAYVDFQDGATQLQFCSDKCLNQYKMHIFCRETQAHLDLNPHLVNASSTSNLITPDLWLKNCKSRSVSPTSERSGTPEKTETVNPLPLITVTPAAKLMNPKIEKVQKSPDNKKEKNKMMRKRRASRCSATVTSQSLRSTTPKAQDLRLRSPSTESGATNPLQSPQYPQFAPVFEHTEPRPFPAFVPRPPLERPRLPIPFPPIGQTPPVTVLVPYPVLLPIPLPIPIPIPIGAFAQAHRLNTRTDSVKEDTEGPLDFTMNDRRRDDMNEINKDKEPPIPNVEEPNQEPEGSPEQTLPKFKITRLAKGKAQAAKTREESTRPLRKRRRLVEVNSEDEPLIPKTRKIVEV